MSPILSQFVVHRIFYPRQAQHHRDRSESAQDSRIISRPYYDLRDRNAQKYPIRLPLRRPQVRESIRPSWTGGCIQSHSGINGRTDFAKLNHVISENQEYDKIKSKILGKTRSKSHNLTPSDARLINDHDSQSLTSKVVSVGREQFGHDGTVERSPALSRVPTRKKWDHCEICLQLTGTKVYFGGSLEFKRYHLSAK